MTPRVRVVVIDYDGGDLTLECLRGLARTDWPAEDLELVLVDNASRRSVTAAVRQELAGVRIIESPTNLGFAGGCNLALRDLDRVDHVALVNNDVSLPAGWLRPLVAALEADPELGAACPKIRFSDRYLDVELHVSHPSRPGRGDRRLLGVRLSGVRVDGSDCGGRARPYRGFWGPEHDAGDDGAYQWTSAHAVVRVPVEGGRPQRAQLRLASDATRDVELVSGPKRRHHTVGTQPDWYEIELDGTPFDVINNAGSVLVDDGYGADRGYLEADDGRFEVPGDVFAWCGGAVLLRASYLRDVGLFDERLFLYYEDLELSWRGRERGWRYRYVPESVVRHVHSASPTARDPELAHYLNERNRLLVLLRHAPLGLVARAIARYLLITASYVRRDVISPWARGEPPRWGSARRRLRALGGYLRLAPAVAAERRRHTGPAPGR